jgi:hypothetical protein
MVTCPACGASNSETREYCLGCMGDLPATRALDRVAAGGTGTGASNGASVATAEGMTADMAVPSTTAANRVDVPGASVAAPAFSESESLVIPSSACPRHPDMPAAGTCVRCGTFFCARCVPSVLEKNIECPSCLESKEARDAPATVKAIIQEQWVTLALLGLLVSGVGFASVIAAPWRYNVRSDEAHLALAGLNGAIWAVPFAIAALMVGLVRRMWAIWVGYVIEAIMFVLIALSSFGFNFVTAIAVCAPIWSLVRVLRLAELMKKYPSARAASPSA